MRYGDVIRFNQECGACRAKFSALVTVVKADAAPWIAYLTQGGAVYFAWPNDATRLVYDCACGRSRLAHQVVGKVVADKKCDERCTGAIGQSCECSCGGLNHGAAHAGGSR